MTQENKELLLKDLCARLPYHPHINVCNDSWEGCQTGEFDTNLYSYHIDAFVCDRIEVKPYLRPMPSMTEEEKKEYDHYLECMLYNTIYDGAFASDYLNAHHLDYHGLIPKGLAIAVTKENNPYANN